MLAFIAAFVFFLAAILGWIDKTIPVEHLLSVVSVGLVFIALHLALRIWWPDRRW